MKLDKTALAIGGSVAAVVLIGGGVGWAAVASGGSDAGPQHRSTVHQLPAAPAAPSSTATREVAVATATSVRSSAVKHRSVRHQAVRNQQQEAAVTDQQQKANAPAEVQEPAAPTTEVAPTDNPAAAPPHGPGLSVVNDPYSSETP